MEEQKKKDELGQQGEIRQYERSDRESTVRGDELNPNKGGDTTPIYVTGDSTLQTPEEAEHDRSVDPTKDNTIAVSKDDLHETNADRAAGTDRAGTAERKPINDTGNNES